MWKEGQRLNRFLKELWQRWVRFSKRIADWQARLLLSMLYFLMILPIGLIVRVFADPLALKKTPAQWDSKPGSAARLEDAGRQF